MKNIQIIFSNIIILVFTFWKGTCRSNRWEIIVSSFILTTFNLFVKWFSYWTIADWFKLQTFRALFKAVIIVFGWDLRIDTGRGYANIKWTDVMHARRWALPRVPCLQSIDAWAVFISYLRSLCYYAHLMLVLARISLKETISYWSDYKEAQIVNPSLSQITSGH